MLHGEIKVNDYEIGHWKAVRVGAVLDSKGYAVKDHYIYRCEVRHTDLRGYTRRTGPFLVHHRFSDGAIVLTSQVLAQAEHLFAEMDRHYGK